MYSATVLNSRLFIEDTGYASMVEPEPPEDPKFPKLFDSGRDEETGARDFLLWIEECYIEAEQYHDPSITETYSDEDLIRFAELGPKPGVVASRYLAESAGDFGNWKIIVRRNDKGRMKTPWAYEFETIEGDLDGLCRYMREQPVTYSLRKKAPS